MSCIKTVSNQDLILFFADADLYTELSDLLAINARLAKVCPTALEKRDLLPHMGDGTHALNAQVSARGVRQCQKLAQTSSLTAEFSNIAIARNYPNKVRRSSRTRFMMGD